VQGGEGSTWRGRQGEEGQRTGLGLMVQGLGLGLDQKGLVLVLENL